MQTKKLNTQQYKIGELAQKAGVKVETLRYYETQGLLIAQMRTSSGYRLYSQQDIQSLFFILHAKKVGFALKEIKFLLDFQHHKSEHTCEDVKKYTGNKLSEIEAKIADLKNMHGALTRLHQACCGGIESAQNCSILQSLEDSRL